MACRGNIFLLNASAELAKGDPKNYIPAEAVRRIAETFGTWSEIEKYSRIVTCEEIAKNDYNIVSGLTLTILTAAGLSDA